MPPSEVIGSMVKSEDFALSLQEEYEKGEEFSQYVDSQSLAVLEIADKLYGSVVNAYNEYSTYDYSFSDALRYAFSGSGVPVDVQRLKSFLESKSPDMNFYSKLAAYVPHTKLDTLPPGEQIPISDSIPLDLDYNGVSITTGYLTVSQYNNNIAYPGMGVNGDNLPDSLIKSISEGYKGYPTLQPLDDLLRPGLADLPTSDDFSNLKEVGRSAYGLGTMDSIKDLSGIGALSSADQTMYSIDIADIIVERNGYTVYDPATDSNGDFIDVSLMQNITTENGDPNQGSPSSDRTRSTTFNRY
ncbi:hypothetical protein EBT25_04380 [bacterium]|nr:hypothetical protein [bacterium]